MRDLDWEARRQGMKADPRPLSIGTVALVISQSEPATIYLIIVSKSYLATFDL